MDWNQLVQWAFEGVMTAAVIKGIDTLGKLRDEIEALNQKMATVLEKNVWHERELEKLDERISRLEDPRRS